MILLVSSVILAASAFIDGLSTIHFLRKGLNELNPLLGSRPSSLRIFGEGAVIITAEIIAAVLLNHVSDVIGYFAIGGMLVQSIVHVNRAIHNFRL